MTKLKEVLKKKGVSQQLLLDMIRANGGTMYASNLSLIVNGGNCTLETLLEICKALEVTPNDIIDYESVISESDSK